MKRRPQPKRSRSSFLDRPWLYAALGVITLMLYGWPLMRGVTTPRQPVDTVHGEVLAGTELLMQGVDVGQVIQAVRRKPVLGWLLGFWSVLMTGMGLAGALMAVRTIRRRRLARLFRYRPRMRRFWSMRELLRITVLAALVIGMLPFAFLSLIAWGCSQLTDPNVRNLASTVVLDGMLALIVWAFASLKAPSPAAVLGLTAPKNSRPILQGLVSYVAVFPWMLGLLWLIARTCQELGIEPPIEPIHQLLFLDTRAPVIVLTVVLACVVGPVIEELFFRGILFVAVRRHTSRLAAMLVSGSLFAAMHTNLIGFLPILLLGCFLADLYERTGSLLAPIAVHILHNTLLIGVGLTIRAILLQTAS